jgi:hypothetical protein
VASTSALNVWPSLASLRCTVLRSTPRLRATCSTEHLPVGSRSSTISRSRSGVVGRYPVSIDPRNWRV